jgi:hypothetical protein
MGGASRKKWRSPEALRSRGTNASRTSLLWVPLMTDHRREIYQSENGDRWSLCRDDNGRVFVLHKGNLPSGGAATEIELEDFLGRGKAGPEHQALVHLIGKLVEG